MCTMGTTPDTPMITNKSARYGLSASAALGPKLARRGCPHRPEVGAAVARQHREHEAEGVDGDAARDVARCEPRLAQEAYPHARALNRCWRARGPARARRTVVDHRHAGTGDEEGDAGVVQSTHAAACIRIRHTGPSGPHRWRNLETVCEITPKRWKLALMERQITAEICARGAPVGQRAAPQATYQEHADGPPR
jgi:hypothetical protein